MSSPCLSGAGRTYGFDLEIVKSPSISTRTSHTSSPSSTLSESCNSPLAISTRKPRTPRKRPNQTYNEAAALLSTVYPSIFSTKNLKNPHRFSIKPHDPLLLDEPSDILLPFRVFDNSGFLLHQPIREKPSFANEPRVANSSSCEKSCHSPGGEVDFHGKSTELCDGYQEDFDAESILDEEIEEGIDSIMGNLSVSNEIVDGSNNDICASHDTGGKMNSWYGNPLGFNFGGKFPLGLGVGLTRGVRALRHVDEGNWWNFPTVDMLQISPRLNNKCSKSKSNWNSTPNSTSNSNPKSKSKPNSNDKKKRKVQKPVVETDTELAKENSIPAPNPGLLLSLNYDEVLNAWSDRGSPFADEVSGCEGTDVHARLAQIDLFSESGVREASVLRYKEKRRSRLFSKKIRYQVRKVNADRRPRMKGRFVRRSNSSGNDEDEKE